MAKTRSDYFNAGVLAAKAHYANGSAFTGHGLTRGSWQCAAFEEGWLTIAIQNPTDEPVTRPESVVVTPVKIAKSDIPQIVLDHINSLARMRATETDEKRRMRLLDKSIALKNKWSKRAFAAHARTV